ncbi:hypothetical protein [Moraxella nasicaprae]|uniref:Lipoprotein n=1 Tax=Moraxella nasicaprae TaxID=2904122 RepID=A0ABY6F4E9_9GAMM|nr:hypothetical protein [Moraxella nasicaprae]UXZ04960.1 hypothetical protein LU297_00445 [Moraxella nasicaprae]
MMNHGTSHTPSFRQQTVKNTVRVLMMSGVFWLTGCHHWQLANNPIPVSLNDTSLPARPIQRSFVLPSSMQHEQPSQKNKPSKKPTPTRFVYLLENWF